jgi:hypothetical protein
MNIKEKKTVYLNCGHSSLCLNLAKTMTYDTGSSGTAGHTVLPTIIQSAV